MSDARTTIALKSDWVKGHVRLGTALLALEDVEAKEALEVAVKLEPRDDSIRVLLDKAIALYERQAATGQHKFKKAAVKRERESGGVGASQGLPGKRTALGKEPVQVKKPILSFDEEEDDDS